MSFSPTLHDWDVLFFGVPLIMFLVVGFFPPRQLVGPRQNPLVICAESSCATIPR